MNSKQIPHNYSWQILFLLYISDMPYLSTNFIIIDKYDKDWRVNQI